MPLELKDLASQKMLVVPEEGLTFGREGGDANIQLRDTGVSKRHARVFENGAWFLEDLGSSNGTWLQKERIKDATELLPGDIFQMSQAKFEVLQVMAGEDAAEPTAMAQDEDGDEAPEGDEPPAEENEPTPKPMQPAAKEGPSKSNKAAPPPKENSASAAKAKPAPPAPSSKKVPPAKGDAGKKTEAGVPDSGGEPKKKSGFGMLFGSVGLIVLPTVLGLTANFISRALHSTGSSTSTSVDAQVAAAEAQAEAARKQAEAQGAAAEKQAEAATAAAEKQIEKAEKGTEKAAAPTPPPADEKKAVPPAPTPAPAAPAPTPKVAEKAPEAAPAAPTGAGYGAWHAKWEAIEKRITDDPTVLNKDAAVLSLYKKLEEDVYEVEQKWGKGKKAAEKRVSDHLRDAELYEKTEKTVLELHGKLFH